MHNRNLELFVTATEFKFVGDSSPGVFSGYGSVFHNVDSHKDVIAPGAFTATLAKYAQMGTLPGMYAEHSAYTGGDPLPIGKWTKMEQDDHGLKVEGKIVALDTDGGRRMQSLMMEGVVDGLSIAFMVPRGGAIMGKKQGEPRRTLTAVNLYSVDVVRDPSNSAARIQQLKSAFRARLKEAGGPGDPNDLEPEDAFAGPDVEDAIEALEAAIIAQDKLMSDFTIGASKDAALLMDALRNAYEALTGERIPDGLVGWTKNAALTIRATEAILREEFGLSHARASEIAKRRFGSLPRDEGSTQANRATKKAAIETIVANLDGFSLT